MKSLSTIAFAILAVGNLSAQDKVTLSTGETLHGDILSISDDKTLSLKHLGSKTPLLIDATKTSRLDLNSQGKKMFQKPTSIVSLSNGDLLPGSIESITDGEVKINSAIAGNFTLKRSDIDYISFGASVIHPVYKFNNLQKAFTTNRNWTVANGNLESQQSSEMWQKMPLTDNFIVKCQLEWTQNPQLTFHLAAQTNTNSSRNNRYKLLLQASGTSMTLHHPAVRRQTQSARTNLRSLNKNKVDVEIWVSQSKGKVTLLFDGKKVHDFSYSNVPRGSFLGLQNGSASGKLIVKNLAVLTWDGKQTPENLGYLTTTNQDVIIAKNDTKFSGKLLNTITDEEGRKMFQVEYEHSATGNQSIAESNIQVIKFANKKKPSSKLKPSLLEGGSKLKLANIKIQNDQVTADHAILGPIAIPKKYFSFLELNY